jgi:hypothetical protein
MGKQRIKPNYRRRVLLLPDLDHCKTTVLKSENNPPPSYANCAYYGIQTFRFINRKGETALVKSASSRGTERSSCPMQRCSQRHATFSKERSSSGPRRDRYVGSRAIRRRIRQFYGRRPARKRDRIAAEAKLRKNWTFRLPEEGRLSATFVPKELFRTVGRHPVGILSPH